MSSSNAANPRQKDGIFFLKSLLILSLGNIKISLEHLHDFP